MEVAEENSGRRNPDQALAEFKRRLCLTLGGAVAVVTLLALTISSQILLGVLLGGPGLALATPLTVVAFVLVKKLYIEDTLGDTPGST